MRCGKGQKASSAFADAEIRASGIMLPANGVPVSGSTIVIEDSALPLASLRFSNALKSPVRKAAVG